LTQAVILPNFNIIVSIGAFATGIRRRCAFRAFCSGAGLGAKDYWAGGEVGRDSDVEKGASRLAIWVTDT